MPRLAGGVGVIVYPVTMQGLSHAVRKEAWKFLLGYFPWDSTLDGRKVLHRTKTYDTYAHRHTPAVLFFSVLFFFT